MKHFTQTTANGLHTPPCGSSQSKSTRFSLLTSLLLFVLMFVGNNAAWASTNYFTPGKTIHVHKNCSGSGFCAWGNDMGVIFFYQDEPTKAYGCDCTSEYSKLGTGQQYNSSAAFFCTKDDDYNWHFTIPTPPEGKHIGYFRILKLEGSYWCHQQMKICSADDFSGSNNCVTYSQWDYNTGDQSQEGLTSEWSGGGENILNDGAGGGGGDPEPEPGQQTLTESYCLRGDLWLGSGGGWESAGTIPSPSFTANNDNTIATLSYVIPAISQGAITSRITLHGDNHGGSNYKLMKTVWDSENSNITQNDGWTDEKGLLNVPQQGSFAPKKITLEVTKDASGEHLKGTISDYTVKRDGWHLYVDNYWVGEMNNNGELILLDAGYTANSEHSVYITNSKRNGEISRPDQYWSQGISWFGGLYIDKSNSNVSWGTQRKYYGDKFSNQAVFPTKGEKDGCGNFKVTSATDIIKYKFDGGKITINTLAKQEITDTYVLVGDYQGGWNNQDNDHKFSDDHYTKIVSLTLAQNATGVQDKGANGKWFRFKGCKWNDWGTQLNRSNTTLIGDDNVIDKNNSLSDDDNRILVKAPYSKNVYTFTYYVLDSHNYLEISVEEYEEPAVTYTVTLHPNNGGDNIVRENVPENSTASAAALNLSAVTYGNGTATWYTNAECTTPFTSVTEDNMDLYAKWGVSGNFYIGGDMWMHEKNGNNWAYYSTMAMTTTDGVASVTYIAPKGRNRFEILTTRSNWSTIANQGSGLIAASTPTLSWAQYGPDNNYHFVFDLDAPKKVTIRYNGKVSITAEDYDVVKTGWTVVSPTLFGNGSDDNADYADNGAFMSGYNVTEGQMNENGERVFRNINPGTYKFWIGKYNTNLDKTKQQIEVFGAANVDKANSSLSGYGSLADNNNAHINRNIPQDDKLHRRVQFTLTQTADVKISFDGGKITVNVLPTHTVTFKDGATTLSTAQVFDGNVATAPDPAPTKSGYSSVKWQLNGVDYNFSTPVEADIQLDAVWTYKAITSVSLNEGTHTTWVGNSDFTLTPTLDPADGIAKTVVWSSNAEGVATVSNGTVHAVAAGEARITVTVTDQFDNVRTDYCEVSVAACEMTTDNLYSMTVTGNNTYDGSSATLTDLWDESTDNTEPASMTITRLAFQKKDAGQTLYAYDDNGTVKVKEDASGNDVQWILIPVGENYTPSWNGGNACQLYYIKNVSTGKFMHRGTQGQDGSGFNAQWWYSVTNTNATNAATDDYKWFFVNENDNQRGVYVKSGVGDSKPNSYKLHSSNEFNNCTDTYAPKPMLPVGRTADMNAYAKAYKNTNDFNYDTYSNPNYKASQMNSSYYRMKENATVQANLANGLAYGSVITVRLYADAATSVKLQTAAGDDVETINLSADAAREYTYTVAYGSELVGATAFIIKAADNHAGIASIEVSRMHAVDPSSPALTWDANLSEGVTQSALAGTFQHVASSALSEGTIHYTSSNKAFATVAADGTVTPIMAGSTTITATIEAEGCYAEQSITYNVTLTEPTLAEMIAADAGAGITLTHDYAENIVIDKAVTIDGAGHAIGNLTVQTAGDLTLSGALTVNDFSIYAKAGNTTTPAASGQVRNAANLTANGNAYFYYTVDPSGTVHYGWYDFTVPFRVNVMTGIKGIQEGVLKENFVNETDYAIMEHLGEKQAAGQYAYKKFRGIMEPCRLYSITLDDDYNYNTVRFQKTSDGALVAGNEVTLNTYASTVDDKHSNWNGVGNGTLHHADAILSTVGYIQVYQSGEKTFLPVDRGQYSLVVGSAFMVQQAGTMTLNQASHDKLLAPRRDASAQATAIQIAREGKPFSDQLFISADETAGQGYTQGVDVAKAGNIGNVNVPQIWTNAYNSKLCAHEAQLIDGEAQYTLSLYAPANGTYTLTSKNIPEGYTLYLTQNGNKLWDMSDTYVLDLTKGTTTEYGLLLVENYKMPTAVDNIFSNTDETTKIMRSGILYILQNGKVFNAQGARVK